MNQGTKQAQQGMAPRAAGAAGGELMRAKLALVAAHDRAEPDALAHTLATYPAHLPDLVEFSTALRATSGYEHEALTAHSAAVAGRALDRALAAVFGGVEQQPATPVAGPVALAQGVVATLKALRKARGLTPRALGERVGLGVDVVSSLEHGLVRVASIPERLVKALAEALGTNLDEITTALTVQPAIVPKFQRAQHGATKTVPEQPELDFAEAVRTSPNMSAAEKASWLID
ncbi:MAG: helix-turn-helix domain-containing protein [Ktedonobacterales bacterium]